MPKAGQAVLSGLVTNQAGKALNLSATLVPDGSTWKLYALHTDKPNGDHQTENRFTLVGKGADFRDVYHQPIPDAPELAALAQETMAKFAEALQRRNFQSFYEYVAQGWRDGTVPSGPEANGDLAMPTPAGNQIQADGRLTVPLLQSNFGPFIEKKVDLTQMAKTPPGLRPPATDRQQWRVKHGGLLYGWSAAGELQFPIYLRIAGLAALRPQRGSDKMTAAPANPHACGR